MIVITSAWYWKFGPLRPPAKLGRFLGLDWISETWRAPPVIGWQRATANELTRYPLLTGKVWFRLGPLDINFEALS